ncbi:hypothetical protein [Phytohabitans aurantiacus]|uniref:DUF4244 domain-containing protein n=1 Tax=Phytohabitans aurantiacus TaxID=3016789 RepID=A0ABQ5QW74_9ACTN|nr:hypothetical protein [Phytohabitans aurantiacus]GLH98813.1 hypothetical protein Pa4123_40880 [Phytohabitans aurantiacus]
MTTTIRTVHATCAAVLRRRIRTRHRPSGTDRDTGSHAVEYALGIGLGAATILALFAAYKSGVAALIESWIFK